MPLSRTAHGARRVCAPRTRYEGSFGLGSWVGRALIPRNRLDDLEDPDFQTSPDALKRGVTKAHVGPSTADLFSPPGEGPPTGPTRPSVGLRRIAMKSVQEAAFSTCLRGHATVRGECLGVSERETPGSRAQRRPCGARGAFHVSSGPRTSTSGQRAGAAGAPHPALGLDDGQRQCRERDIQQTLASYSHPRRVDATDQLGAAEASTAPHLTHGDAPSWPLVGEGGRFVLVCHSAAPRRSSESSGGCAAARGRRGSWLGTFEGARM